MHLLLLLAALNICYGFYKLSTPFLRRSLCAATPENDAADYVPFLSFSLPSQTWASIPSFVNDWAKEMVKSGSAITAEETSNGVAFYFIPSPGSFLDICITNSSTATELNIDITKRIVVRKSNAQVESLIKFAAQNLLDTLAHDLSDLVVEVVRKQQAEDQALAEATGSTTQTRIIEMDEDEVDLEELERRAKPWPPVPSEEELFEMLMTSQESSIATLPADEEVFSWDSGDSNEDTVRDVLLLWAEKFAGRGAGITSAPISHGIELEFAISSALKLQYLVATSSSRCTILSRLVGPVEETSERSLIVKAAKNMDTSLKKYLSGVSLAPSAAVAEGGRDEVEPALFEDKLDVSIASAVKAVSSPPPLVRPDAQVVRKKDPKVLMSAQELGVDLSKYEGKGLEDQAVRELQQIMDASKKEGFLATVKQINRNASAQSEPLEKLFEAGANISRLSWEAMLARNYDTPEDLSIPPTTFPIDLQSAGLEKGIDIFEGPPMELVQNPPLSSIEGQRRLEATLLFPPKQENYASDLQKIEFLLNELKNNVDEMHPTILDSFKDALLADNFLFIMKQLNATQTDGRVRTLCTKIVDAAKVLTAELGVLAKTESVRHLETIHDLCQVSARYQQDELKFLEELDYLKPRFDTALLGYLSFAVNEERAMITARGSDPDRLPSKWLQVLTVIQQGVLAEFETRFNRLLEPLLLTVRFEQPELRRVLLGRFVNITQPLELYYMRELAVNMATATLALPDSELPEPSLRPKLVQLLQDVELFLSEETIDAKVAAFVASTEKQGKKVVMRHRNPVMQLEVDLQAEYGDGEESSAEGQVGLSVLDRRGAK